MTVAALLVAGFCVSGSLAAPAPPSPPAGLAKDLKAFDDKINQTVESVKNDELTGTRRATAVDGLRDDLRAIVVKYFPDVWGLNHYTVFIGFAGIDVYIDNAREWVDRGNDEKTATSLDHAVAELKGLQSDLTSAKASGVPPAVLDGLKDMKGGLAAAARHFRNGSGTIQELAQLSIQKHKLIADNTQDIKPFGQPFKVLYDELYLLELALEKAQYGYPFGDNLTKHQEVGMLRHAGVTKEYLRSTVIPPNVSAIDATFYASGAAKACEDAAPDVNNGETCYGASATSMGPAGTNVKLTWHLEPPLQDPDCKKFKTLDASSAVWHHGDEDGCNHAVEGSAGHAGLVWLEGRAGYWTCVATYQGTNDPDATTKMGPPAVCFPNTKQRVLTVAKAGVGAAGNSRAAPSGSGTVTSSPAGISCDASCQSASFGFGPNSTVTLTATADGSSTFLGWSGAGCSGTGSCTVTTDATKTVMATFQHN